MPRKKVPPLIFKLEKQYTKYPLTPLPNGNQSISLTASKTIPNKHVQFQVQSSNRIVLWLSLEQQQQLNSWITKR